MFLDKEVVMNKHSISVDQYVPDFSFKDPVVVLLDSYISDHPKASNFIYSSTRPGEYGFMNDALSMMIYFCYCLLRSNRNMIISALKLLEWLHWKADYT